jgi:8-oxo-dGTP pyrophosphatase MutT (NUDIX family)
MSDTPAPARPSASVAVVRQSAGDLEVLLVKRNENIAFHGGAWVFPGGRVDETDAVESAQGGERSEIMLAARAAVREAREEAGLVLDTNVLVPFAHWTTPATLPKRFATWFFLAQAGPDATVRIDQSEIVEHCWMTPSQALALQASGDMNLPGPTFVSLLRFRECESAAALGTHLRDHQIQHFVPRLAKLDGGHCAVYEEDAGYQTLDLDTPGRRHRLLMLQQGWQYQRDFPLSPRT